MMAGVAQLVEHQIVALVVAGSSPVARPQKKDIQFDLDILFFILQHPISANYLKNIMYKILVSFVLLFVFAFSGATAQESKLDSLVKAGISLHNQGNYRAAIDTYKNALKDFPGESILHYELAVSYSTFGIYEKALEHVNRVNDPSGKYEEEAILLKSSILQALYKYDLAIKLLKEALPKYGANPLFHFNLANAYYSKGEDNLSILSLIETLKINPTHANSHFLMARVFSKHFKKTESIMAYYYFLLVEPDSPKSKISLKLIDNLIGLGVTKKNNDTVKAEIYVSPDTSSAFSDADLLLSLTATNFKVSHYEADTDEEILFAKMVAFFSILEQVKKENPDTKNFMINFYAKFFIDMHKAHHTETFCRYIRQSVSSNALEWLKKHPKEVKEFEDWLNSYYNK